MSYALTID